MSFGSRITTQRLAGKIEETIKVFEIIEYDTHRKVILWRSRVGDGLRPKICVCVLQYCKRVVLEFSRGFTGRMRVLKAQDFVQDFQSRVWKFCKRCRQWKCLNRG